MAAARLDACRVSQSANPLSFLPAVVPAFLPPPFPPSAPAIPVFSPHHSRESGNPQRSDQEAPTFPPSAPPFPRKRKSKAGKRGRAAYSRLPTPVIPAKSGIHSGRKRAIVRIRICRISGIYRISFRPTRAFRHKYRLIQDKCGRSAGIILNPTIPPILILTR